MLKDLQLAFIGAGMMGEAMIAGLLKEELVPADQIIATHHREERRHQLHERYGVTVTSDNRHAADQVDVIVFTLKPQTLPKVLPTLRGAVKSSDLVLSIIAGIPIATFRDMLAHASVVRAMPNTPAQIAEGMSVWTATESVTEAQHAAVRTILGALGKEHYVADEKYIDMATAISGTGPAYCFLLLEAMVDAGVHLGFQRRVAEELVLQTMYGSTLFAMQSGKHLAELRNMVTSPGGTSAAALHALERGGLRTVLAEGVWAAYERARELGQ
jgi:pyrroline-5-carboxylate reductase